MKQPGFMYVLLVLLLSACAGTQTHLRMLESDGTIKTDIADDPSYDYKVLIENHVDFGWDGDNEADRIKTVNLMFKDTCKQTQVIDQLPIKKGKTTLGNDSIVWVMKIKCNN